MIEIPIGRSRGEPMTELVQFVRNRPNRAKPGQTGPIQAARPCTDSFPFFGHRTQAQVECEIVIQTIRRLCGASDEEIADLTGYPLDQVQAVPKPAQQAGATR